MAEKVIIIGGTAAGLSAASKAKRVDPSLEITVFERSGYISYGACGLPYFVGGIIDQPDDLVSLNVDQMTNQRGVPTFIHHEVTSIDRTAQTVTVRDLDSGKSWQQPYDKLVIATGARAIVPDIPGADAEGVYTLRTVEDGIRLKSTVQGGEHKAIAIVGGGFIGLEMAEELTNSGLEVHLFEVMPRLLPFLEERFSAAVLDVLQKHGVYVHLNAEVAALETADGHVCGVQTKDGAQIPVNNVLLSIGVRPASELAKDAGLELGLKGGIVVDDEMRTSDPHIWACGDCVQMKNRITRWALRPTSRDALSAAIWPVSTRPLKACSAPWSPRRLSCTSLLPAFRWRRHRPQVTMQRLRSSPRATVPPTTPAARATPSA